MYIVHNFIIYIYIYNYKCNENIEISLAEKIENIRKLKCRLIEAKRLNLRKAN